MYAPHKQFSHAQTSDLELPAGRRRPRSLDDEAEASTWGDKMPPLSELRSFRRECLQSSVAEEQNSRYMRMASNCIELTGGIDFWHQMQFLRLMRKRHVLGSMNNDLNAFRFYRKVMGMYPLQAHEVRDLKDVAVGIAVIKLVAGEQKEPRGAMNLTMLRQLVGLARQLNEHRLMRGFIVAWSGALRHNELMKLKLRQVRFETEGSASLRIPMKRTMKQRVFRRGCGYHVRPVTLDIAVAILKSEKKRGGDGCRLLFAGWDAKAANELIHRAARVFEWDEDYTWDGLHTLRHGAAEEAAERVAKMTRAVQVTGGWNSVGAPVHYAGGARARPMGPGAWR